MNHQKINTEYLNYQHHIENILTFLFEYQLPEYKAQQYPEIIQNFEQLDLVACYTLFGLVEKKLPYRARMLFAGENYQGKRETLLEVFEHVKRG